MTKRVIILGSTGSIGRSALDVLSTLEDEWTVVGLAAGSRAEELAEQAERFHPEALAIANGERVSQLDAAITYSPRVFSGPNALFEIVDQVPCDCVVAAVVGADALHAVLRAVELGRRIALANKEALVVAGSLLMPLAERTKAEIIPVDSEHSAIFQALLAGQTSEVRHVYLTASGGPFLNYTEEELDNVTVESALQHPVWKMGPKITIDSATLMNKAMEIVEARWLFRLRPEQIGVVIHPESIIHSMVEFRDGSLIAQMGTPDMRTPIQYALTYPNRRPCSAKRLDLAKTRQLNFRTPDENRFPALQLGHEVARRGGTCGAVLNAANEEAVRLFREAAMPFRDIARVTEQALRNHDFLESPNLDQLLTADRWARKEVARCMAC